MAARTRTGNRVEAVTWHGKPTGVNQALLTFADLQEEFLGRLLSIASRNGNPDEPPLPAKLTLPKAASTRMSQLASVGFWNV
jgi:hypothetical protein